jgi:hypothetical protein
MPDALPSEPRHVTLKAKTGLYSSSFLQADMKIRRGGASWAYLYVAFGFAITLEGIVFQLLTPPLKFPANILGFVLSAGLTVYYFIFDGRFINRVFTLKQWYENRWL